MIHRLGAALGTALSLFSLSQPALAQDKFALGLFHFNVQYVCGGTLGYTVNPNPTMDRDNDAIEDQIIVESFAPIVELYERHPDWGVDLEMQAYMLDVIADRHPQLLGTLQKLSNSGQVDINSFHYSDQLFIGYPQESWQRSQDATAATFEKHNVRLSKTVFCQEGQSAMGMADHFESRGYQTMVWPKNLWTYQHGEFDAQPLYRFGEKFLVAGAKSVNYDDGKGTTVKLQWTFLDDGELLATNDLNPYFPDLFKHDPAAVADYEKKLQALADDGFTITTVDKYVEAIKDRIPLAEPPPLLDGTWQPDSTDGVARWLGGSGLWRQQERDNHVRSVGAQAQRELVHAEQLATQAKLDLRDQLDSGWRMLFLGQVTDATGINPFRGEIQYGIAHMAEAMRIAGDVIEKSKGALGSESLRIDYGSGSSTTPADLRGQTVAPPMTIAIESGDRSLTETWEAISANLYRLQIDFGPGEFYQLSVVFPGALEETVALSLALSDNKASSFQRSAFTFEEFHFALPTGYIGLGEQQFVIKDMAHVHLAATLKRDQGGVRFEDKTVPPQDAQRWVFFLFEGSPDDAVQMAQQINVRRSVVR